MVVIAEIDSGSDGDAGHARNPGAGLPGRQLAARWLCGLLCCMAMAGPLHAADVFPGKALRIIVPFAPGAGADTVARFVGQKLSQSLAQAVVVENRPGANGLIGAEAAARSAADGYTMILLDRSVLGVNPSLYRSLPYDPARDFAYLGIATWAPYVMVVHPSVPAKNLDELISYAKANAGKVDYASFGKGSLPQIDMELLKSKKGLSITAVPYKGAAPAITATMAGEVAVTLSSIGSLAGAIKDGRLRPIVLGAARRSPVLPEVPTLREAGGDDDTLLATYFGFALPQATPRPVVDKLGKALGEIVAQPASHAQFAALGMDPGAMQAREMEAVVRQDIERFARIARDLGIQPE